MFHPVLLHLQSSPPDIMAEQQRLWSEQFLASCTSLISLIHLRLSLPPSFPSSRTASFFGAISLAKSLPVKGVIAANAPKLADLRTLLHGTSDKTHRIFDQSPCKLPSFPSHRTFHFLTDLRTSHSQKSCCLNVTSYNLSDMGWA